MNISVSNSLAGQLEDLDLLPRFSLLARFILIFIIERIPE